MDENEELTLTTERLTALLLTAPQWNGNYTSSRNLAEWLIGEADRLRWTVYIGDPADASYGADGTD